MHIDCLPEMDPLGGGDNMQQRKTRELVGVALLAAIGYLLMFLAFPIIPAFPFMKVDFSEITILVSTYLFGPLAGVMTALIRSVLHMITSGEPAAIIGDTASFIAALSFVLPIFYISKRKQRVKSLILGFGVGTLLMTAVMSVLNLIAIIPLYTKMVGFDIGMSYSQYVIFGVIPFNILKGIIVSLVFMLIHEKLFPQISRLKNVK